MTQDNDDLLAQVFSVLPPTEHTTIEHHEINGNNIKEESKEYLNANVRRVSNAFQDFLEKSGVVETNFQSVTESHSESHFHTTHVETHHEVITSHHEEHHHEEQHIGHGATFESHTEHYSETIGSGAVVHEEEHHQVQIGNGASLVAGEQLPPGHELFSIGNGAEVSEEIHIGSGAAVVTEESHTIGHQEEVHEDHHIGQGAAVITQENIVIGQGAQVSEESFGIGHGAAPQESFQEHNPILDDKESVISVRTGLSEATSVSVHSSVSQKSVQIYSDAPVKPPSSRHSAVSQNSASTVKETLSHTHDKESTISLSSVHSNNSTLTGNGTAVQSYVIIEKSEVVDAGSELSTPVAPLKSAPHDAVIQEFKQLHHREPSEVSVPPVPTSSPPPLDDEDNSSEVVKTMRVTEFEFDSNHIKNTVLVERHEEHHHSHEHDQHHEEHHHQVDQYEHKYEEPAVLHYEETHTHIPLGEGVQVQHHEDHVIGEGVQLTGYHHHESEDEFKFEYVEQSHVAVENSAHSVVASVVAKSDPPPVFFQSPVLTRRVPSNVPSHVESDSDDDTITGSTHHHHHTEHHEHHEHHQHHENHDSHGHHEHHEFRELVPNINRAHVRDLPRPAHVTQETRTVTVVKTVAPIAHVTPVVSQEKIEVHHTPATVDVVPVVQTHLHEHHGHNEHHHNHEHQDGEKHYHKHSEQLEEVFSGPSVRDLKSKFEQGGKVDVHYSTHYISHHGQEAQEIEHVHLKHEHEHHSHEHDHHTHEHEHHAHEHSHEHEIVHQQQHHDHHHHHHEQHSHHDHHHQDQGVVVYEVHAKETSVPHLPHRESHKQVTEEVSVLQHEVEHKHHHRHHHHHHHHDKHHEHKHRHHRHHHHEHDHHHHEHIEVEAVQVQKQVHQESIVEQHHHNEHTHHHEHHDHHVAHHEHEEIVHTEQVHVEHAVEEEQLPVSLLLSKYGGGAKLRRPDHVEEIKIYSTSVVLQEQEAPVVYQTEPLTKSRTVTQTSVTTGTTRPSRSATACSVQSCKSAQSCKSGTTCQSGQRSHSCTLTQSHAADVHHAPTTPVPAPVAAARSSSSDHQSVRVVKSVRAFVSQWGQKDFQPPTSPVITVPRLPATPQKEKEFFPEPTSRKSTVVSHVEHTAAHDHHAHNDQVVQKNERAHSVAYSERSVAKSVSARSDVSARSVATSEATSVASSNNCDCCSICGKSKASKATSKASSKRSSVASEASTVTTTTYSVHKAPQEFVEPAPVTNHIIPEVHEEFVLTPLSERRALFEQGINRGYSIRRNLHGDLRPMVNVFTD